ncbi:MAG: dTDP-4-dehydrorhamnose 3,5-epimerase [Alphaproteobacteria bacterium]
MRFLETELDGVLIVEPELFRDDRGFFMETYHSGKFAAAGIAARFVQDNHSRSRRGTLRGLHYQEPDAQGKLVRAVRGRIYDVAVDIRRGSPQFGRWLGVELDEENNRQLWVPPGFAHGFCTLSEDSEVVYKCTAHHVPESERAVRWDDPELAIDWPVDHPILSPRDAAAPSLAAAPVLPAYDSGR